MSTEERRFCYTGKGIPTFFANDVSKFNWSSKIKVRSESKKNEHVYIYGNQDENPYTCKSQICKEGLPVVKSNLQKCVRRKLISQAIRSAFAMWTFDPNEVLRRLPAIMIEDSLIYPEGLLKLVWWMMAVSKGYRMSKNEVEMMLGIVVTLCESNKYDVAHSSMQGKDVDWSCFSTDRQELYWAIEMRKMYGGMAVDLHMYAYHQGLWYDRLKDDKWWELINNQDENTVELDSVGKIKISDIIDEAIDYHCFPWIVRKLEEKYNLSEKRIKIAIWMCRSRINVREPIDYSMYSSASAEAQNDYDKIKDNITSLTTWIRKNFKFIAD